MQTSNGLPGVAAGGTHTRHDEASTWLPPRTVPPCAIPHHFICACHPMLPCLCFPTCVPNHARLMCSSRRTVQVLIVQYGGSAFQTVPLDGDQWAACIGAGAATLLVRRALLTLDDLPFMPK